MGHLSDWFDECCPLEAQRLLLDAARGACRGRYTEAERRWPMHVKDSVPELRRLEFQTSLHGLPLGSGLKVHVRDTPSSTDIEVHGENLILTSLTRNQPVWDVVLHRYRTRHTCSAKQLDFFDELGFKALSADRLSDDKFRLYALMLYGGPIRSDELGLAYIVFPDDKGRIEYSRGINLLERFATFAISSAGEVAVREFDATADLDMPVPGHVLAPVEEVEEPEIQINVIDVEDDAE